MPDVKLGVSYYRFAESYSPAAFAKDAESLGFDSVWVSENTFSAVPKTDPFVALGAFAAVTTKPMLGTAVVRLPLRSPIAMAKACASVDQMSNGRLIFGVGVGGEYPSEFDATGVAMRERGARTDECLQAFHQLWTNEHATHQGKFYRFEDVNQEPKPVQTNGPPIWVGGRGDVALRRTLKHGHGFFPYLFSPSRYQRTWARMEELAAEMGRDASTITRALSLFLCVGETEQEAFNKMQQTIGVDYHLNEAQLRSLNVFGTAEQVIEKLEAYVQVGVEHMTFGFGCPLTEVQHQLELLGTKVLPYFKKR